MKYELCLFQAYSAVYSVEQEVQGYIQAAKEKQKSKQSLEGILQDTERRIDGLLQRTQESQQARGKAKSGCYAQAKYALILLNCVFMWV
jgi:hypothetical protein